MVDSIQTFRDKLQAYMDSKGLRSTSQRRTVTEVFFRSKGHLSIEDVLLQVRSEDPGVGYATVYRTLKLLKECGLALERHFGDGVSRYEVAHENDHHDHLLCMECNAIVEFEDEAIEVLQEQLAKRHGYLLRGHKHELYGLCPACQARRVAAGNDKR